MYQQDLIQVHKDLCPVRIPEDILFLFSQHGILKEHQFQIEPLLEQFPQFLFSHAKPSYAAFTSNRLEWETFPKSA